MKKAVLVIGNPLKGDDAVALYLGKLIEKDLKGWRVFYGEDVPENQLYAIKKYSPDILIVTDATVGLESECEFLELFDSANYIYTTHNIPIEILIKILHKDIKNILFLGINVQKENMININLFLSKSAKKSAEKAFEKIKYLNLSLK